MRYYLSILLLYFIGQARKLYRRCLYKYLIFRIIKVWVLKVYFSYPDFFKKIAYLPTIKSKHFKLITSSNFLSNAKLSATKVLCKPGTNLVFGPRFIGQLPIDKTPDHVLLIEPSIEINEFKNVKVMGGTNLIIHGNFAIHPDVQSPKLDVIPVEYLGFAKLNNSFNKIRLGITIKSIQLNAAISLLGNCSGNYAHWLTENLPKLILIDEHIEYTNLPILVDDWIHPTLLSTIDFFNKNKREIFYVSRWQTVDIIRLIDLSPPSYTPPESRVYFESRNLPTPSHEYFIFSKYSLNKLQTIAWDLTKDTSPPTNKKRIYLKRAVKSTGNGRLIVNADEIDNIIERYGFIPVSPADMSFEQQITLFKQAEFVVSPIGAALINTLFTPKGCKIICLSPYYEKANYFYFSNFMGILGHEIHYVIGSQVETDNMSDHIQHKNYLIKLRDLEAALKKIVN